MTADYAGLLDDLEAEQHDLDSLVGPLDEPAWRTPTPAEGWDVRDAIAHLGWSEELATTALHDAEAFQQRLVKLLEDLDHAGDEMTSHGRAMPGAEVLMWWRDVRAGTVSGLRERGAKDRVPWIAGPMSAMSFATARLMETWAHGQDVADGLGVHRLPTTRLRHVADIGVRTRRHAYLNRGRELPDTDVRVELQAPDGSTWTWGESNIDAVRGSALDFCLVITQRRHPTDTALAVTGENATDWIGIAQAFAGPPTQHRPPSSPS